MKYFIDFEATQFSEEIISIGCIREDGETFYSLVAPKEGKITPFITNLTGITAEMLSDAMSPDRVFQLFYDWAFSNEEIVPEFYCWGDSDFNFVRHTSKRATTLKAKMAMGYICGNMVDYGHQLKKYLNWGSEHGLLKTYNHFNPEAEQNHNALDDAVMLKNVYDEIHSRERSVCLEIFKDWDKKVQQSAAKAKAMALETQPKWNEAGYPVGTICMINSKKRAVNTFASLEEAALWIRDTKCKNAAYDNFDVEATKNRINKAINGGKPYYSIAWRMVR